MPRETDWIKITKPDGKQMIASPSLIKKLLGVDKLEAKVWNLTRGNEALKQRIKTLERPIRQKQVISLLLDEHKPRIMRWLTNRIEHLSFWDLEPLIEDGSLHFKEKAGHRMFYVEGPKE